MEYSLKKLLLLQELEFNSTGARAAQSKIAQLRNSVPQALLAKYDRLASRGKKPVALVSHGVCGACHIRLAVGIAAAVGHPDEVCTCDTCGRFLYSADAEIHADAVATH